MYNKDLTKLKSKIIKRNKMNISKRIFLDSTFNLCYHVKESRGRHILHAFWLNSCILNVTKPQEVGNKVDKLLT